jgi:signal transduction histidine kinase
MRIQVLEKWLHFRLRQSIPFLALAIILFYTYVYFFQVPYAGFEFSSDRSIYLIDSQSNPNGQLELGDELVQIGTVHMDAFDIGFNVRLFAGAKSGDIVPIIIRRNGELMSIPWVYPGLKAAQIIERLNGTWWIPFLLWLLGTATYLFIRPRNSQWRLLIAFNFLTAIWIATGGGPSTWRVLGGVYVFRIALWLCLPVYLHLHWVFPQPFRRIPIGFIYLGTSGLIILDFLRILPRNASLVGFVLAILGSLILLVVHAYLQPEQRAPLRQLARLVALIIVPIISTAVYGLLGGDLRFTALALLGLPLIPASYIYAIYRHQLDQLEIRANRLIVLYFYVALLGSVALIALALLANVFDFSGDSLVLSLLTAIVSGLATIFAFNRFERFIERRILGIPVPPASLLQTYAAQITTKLDENSLADLLANQVLPSLLVRQAALVYFDVYQFGSPHGQALSVLFNSGADDLPTLDDFSELLQQAHIYRLVDDENEPRQPCPWVRLVLPLSLGKQVIGLWLLGRRDPDDFYSQAEIPVLEALASQTAVALTNILQAKNLHALYQANIDRQEQERNQLALELHDDILNQIGLLAMYVDDDGVAPQFYEVYENLTTRFREAIHGLRPVMLSYGLQAAFNELADGLNERSANKTAVRCEIPTCSIRYPTQVEEHLFRIVQQAAENALQHAEAQVIRIYGHLVEGHIELTVADDGVGMPGDESLDLSVLLRHNHFGLAGMFERAALIGAFVQIIPVLNKGTRVMVSWSENGR